MKKHLLILLSALFILSACKKDNPAMKADDRKPEVIIADIATKLSGADSISSFTDAFKNLKLTEDETKDGLTIFAPLNSKRGLNTLNSNINTNQTIPKTTSVPDSLLKDYIVKGVYKLSDLTNGKILTALSGKKLNVFQNADIIKINDFLLSKKAVFENANSTVFAVNTLDSLILVDSISLVPLTEETFSQALQSIGNDINIYHKKQVLMDGILSHDVEIDSLPSIYKNSYTYRQVSDFSLNSTNQLIKQSWSDGYKIINKLNYLEYNAPYPMDNYRDKVLTLKALRAYVYMQLLSYFGNIVITPRSPNVNYVYTNTDKNSVIYAINNDLDSAFYFLPVVQPDHNLLNTNTVKALQAKMALLQKDYQKVNQLTNEIINSSVYQLELTTNIFSNASKEIIWNNSANFDANIQTYFYGRANLPYIRYTEVLLMNAEANLALGNNQKAQQSFDTVMQRSAKSGTINETTLQQAWLSEMKREGNSFSNLVRWNKAASVLGTKGFKFPKNNLLPIPESDIQSLPSLVQNPGY